MSTKFPWEIAPPPPPEPTEDEVAAAEEQEVVIPPGTFAFLADGTPVFVIGPHEDTRQGGTPEKPVELEQYEVARLTTELVEKTSLRSERAAPAAVVAGAA